MQGKAKKEGRFSDSENASDSCSAVRFLLYSILATKGHFSEEQIWRKDKMKIALRIAVLAMILVGVVCASGPLPGPPPDPSMMAFSGPLPGPPPDPSMTAFSGPLPGPPPDPPMDGIFRTASGAIPPVFTIS